MPLVRLAAAVRQLARLVFRNGNIRAGRKPIIQTIVKAIPKRPPPANRPPGILTRQVIYLAKKPHVAR